MKTLLIILACGFATFPVSAQDTTPDPQDLVGSWKVDLRPTPDAEPYYQTLRITKVDNEEKSFAGSFYYDSAMTHTAINTDWGVLTIAFVTEDSSGPYNSTARLIEGKLVGTTHSVGRAFVGLWTAEKIED